MEQILGHKGSKPRTPVEAPNTLKSIAVANILDLVSEGEIVGLVDGIKSIYLDETPIQNADDTFNFTNVAVEWRNGTQNQDYIPGFPSVENELGISVELKDITPYERTFSNLTLNAVRVRLSTPALSKTNTSNGDVSGHSVFYAIDVSKDGGPFVTKLTSGFVGKTMSKYERDHRIELEPATTGWTVRVRRTSANSTLSNIQDKTFVESMVEIVDGKLRYPNSAIVGVKMDASQFNNIPTRAYDMKGRIIRVPKNYNPITRVYATTGEGTSGGIWDGTFKLAWTDNPAWIYFDLVTHPRYGLGHILTDSHLNKWSLYKISKYCDEMVPDGFGDYEPRFTCNLYLQKQADAYKVIQDLATVFRGIVFWSNGEIVPISDMPEDPKFTYTPANVIDGKFTYQGTSAKVRHNVALVSWNDPKNFGRSAVEYIDMPEGIARYGIQETDMTAIGCSSQGQAQRLGRYALLTANYETQTVAFSVGLDGTLVAPGTVIRIADPLKAGKRLGGRIKTVTDSDTITLDSPVEDVLAGDSLTIITSLGVSETRPISSVNIDGTVVNVSPAFSELPVVGTVWAIDRAALQTQKYRVIGVVEESSEDGITYTISAVEHNASKFDATDLGTRIDVPNISGQPSASQRPPTLVTISHYETAGEVLTSMVLNIDWQPSLDAVQYEVEYRRDDGPWIKMPKQRNTSLDIPNIQGGTYKAKVRAFSTTNVVSVDAFAVADHVVPDQTRAPRYVGGNGTNLLPDEYSTLENPTLPELEPNPSAGTVTRNGSDKIVYGAYSLAATAGDFYLFLGDVPNINVAPGKKYIVSFWAKGTAAGSCGVHLQDAASVTYSGTVDVTTAWTRVSVMLDLTASTSNSMRLRFDNDLGAGQTLLVDGVMVEQAIGTNNNPSTYTRGTVARISLAALILAQNAQATADGQIDIYRQSAAPAVGGVSGAKIGDYWQDSDDGKWWYCDGTTWVDATDIRLPQVIIDASNAQGSANTAQTTANQRIRLFVQEGTPTGGTYIIGDMWFQPSTTLTRYYNGAGWSLQADNSVTVQAYTTLVKNGSFEAGDAGWTLSGGTYLEVSTNASYSGARGVVLPPSAGTPACVSDDFPVSKGDRIAVDAFLRNVGGTANGLAYLSIWFYDASGGALSYEPKAITTGTQIGVTEWRRVVNAVIVPAGAGLARIGVISGGQTTGYYAADQFRVVKTQRTESKPANLIPNANFGGANGDMKPWFIGWNPAGATLTISNKKTGITAGADWTIVGNVGELEIYQNGRSTGTPDVIDIYCGGVTGAQPTKIPVKPSTRYEMHAKMANHRTTSSLNVGWYTAAGTFISETGTPFTGGSGGKEESLYQQSGAFVTSPSNAAYAFIFFRRNNTTASSIPLNSYSWYIKPYFGEANEHQIEFSPWVDSAPYNADSIGAGDNFSVVSNTDIHGATGNRRVGLRVQGSRQILGGARNSRASLVAGVSSVRTTAALSANSAGQVTVNAHAIEISGETVTYNAVTNAVTGLTIGATYVIFTIDPFLDGGTRTYYAQSSILSAQQAGDGCVFIGNVTIPSTGSSTGGESGDGDAGDWCVEWDSLLPDGRYARDLKVGEMAKCIDVTDEAPAIYDAEVRDIKFGNEGCYELTTKLGVVIVQSESTPMNTPDGRVVRTPDMLGEAVISLIDGTLYWDYVDRVEFIGLRRVVKIDLGDRMFFAGKTANKTLATHNINYKP